MKTKNHDWFDSKNHRPLFGIMVFVQDKWRHAMRNNEPMLFEKEEDRNFARAVLRKQPAPT